MKVTRRRTGWRRLLRFRVWSLVLFAFVCCVVVPFGPLAWHWAFPPEQPEPSGYWLDGVEYYPPGFELENRKK